MSKNIKEIEIKIALQTWTIQNLLLLVPEKTLTEIHSMGYNYLELAGTAGLPPKEFKQLCGKIKLKIEGIHQPHLRSKNSDKLIAEIKKNCRIFKPKYVTVMLNPYKRNMTESYVEYAKLCKYVGEYLSSKGMTLCYHCFSYDLIPLSDNLDSQSGLDILLQNTSREHLSFELDTYFLFKSNIPYKEILGKCQSRCKAVHVCDIDENHNRKNVGDGIIPWPKLIKDFIDICHVKLFIIENHYGTRLESVRYSYKNFLEAIRKVQGT